MKGEGNSTQNTVFCNQENKCEIDGIALAFVLAELGLQILPYHLPFMVYDLIVTRKQYILEIIYDRF